MRVVTRSVKVREKIVKIKERKEKRYLVNINIEERLNQINVCENEKKNKKKLKTKNVDGTNPNYTIHQRA